MAGVAETAVARLRCAFVVTHLEIELSIVGSELFLSEGTLVLVSHLGAELGTGPFRMFLSLKHIVIQMSISISYICYKNIFYKIIKLAYNSS